MSKLLEGKDFSRDKLNIEFLTDIREDRQFSVFYSEALEAVKISHEDYIYTLLIQNSGDCFLEDKETGEEFYHGELQKRNHKNAKTILNDNDYKNKLEKYYITHQLPWWEVFVMGPNGELVGHTHQILDTINEAI